MNADIWMLFAAWALAGGSVVCGAIPDCTRKQTAILLCLCGPVAILGGVAFLILSAVVKYLWVPLWRWAGK